MTRRQAAAAAGAVLAVAGLTMLSGCTAGGAVSTDLPPTSAAPAGPELWGSAALWVSPEGEVSMCGVPFGDSGWGKPSVCEDPLEVSGVDAAALATSSPAPVEGEDDGWTWSAHVVTGYFDGDSNHFTVTGVDTEEALALQEAVWAPPQNPEPQPTYATDEEKSAALFAEADPANYGCAAPEGGWRDAGDLEGLIGPYSAAYPEQVVGWASLWVADGVGVALIGAAADADLEAVRTGMQKLFPDAACIVTSQVSASQLASARAEPLFGPDPHVARSSSDAEGRTTPDPYLWVGRTAPSDELDAAIAGYPQGFVQLHTWFQRLP
ncbi:hypothetical protein [Herbiconiux sp. YIM B11900]|uniref:hypothetical protein n=1 Tax=Herbiconiux sp. YIM B11900 TaxID=3404131 RepID=UPI003F82F35D